MKTKRALLSAVISACFLLQGSAFALDEPQTQTKPLVLNQLGGLAFGGTVSHKPNGLTFHGDHGYAQYVIPVNAKNYPIILWHGIGQSGRVPKAAGSPPSMATVRIVREYSVAMSASSVPCSA